MHPMRPMHPPSSSATYPPGYLLHGQSTAGDFIHAGYHLGHHHPAHHAAQGGGLYPPGHPLHGHPMIGSMDPPAAPLPGHPGHPSHPGFGGSLHPGHPAQQPRHMPGYEGSGVHKSMWEQMDHHHTHQVTVMFYEPSEICSH
eukprot:1365556-Prymnesium_polylepis.2